jgi:hypothetical protein
VRSVSAVGRRAVKVGVVRGAAGVHAGNGELERSWRIGSGEENLHKCASGSAIDPPRAISGIISRAPGQPGRPLRQHVAHWSASVLRTPVFTLGAALRVHGGPSVNPNRRPAASNVAAAGTRKEPR